MSGIELSAAMLERLRAKPGGDEASVPVVLGDMAVERVEGAFDVVYLVFNTIMNLLAQDAQVACFANAAHHLRPGGAFVVETMVRPCSCCCPASGGWPTASATSTWAWTSTTS